MESGVGALLAEVLHIIFGKVTVFLPSRNVSIHVYPDVTAFIIGLLSSANQFCDPVSPSPTLPAPSPPDIL